MFGVRCSRCQVRGFQVWGALQGSEFLVLRWNAGAEPARRTRNLSTRHLEPSNPEPMLYSPSHMSRIVTDYEAYLFGEGHWLRAWEKMGARPCEQAGTLGYSFAVWAPNARAVSVVGDFNGWDGNAHPLRSLGASGLWEGFIPQLPAGVV